jgi:hypothetical protein
MEKFQISESREETQADWLRVDIGGKSKQFIVTVNALVEHSKINVYIRRTSLVLVFKDTYLGLYIVRCIPDVHFYLRFIRNARESPLPRFSSW